MQGYNIGYYIKRIRQEKGISQEALYKGLCSRSTFTESKAGNSNPPCLPLFIYCSAWGWTRTVFSYRWARRILKFAI